jgi:hypothetical protein
MEGGLSDTILKGDHPRTIPAKFVLIWFSGFRGEDLNVIFYQNMPNLHNRLKEKFERDPSRVHPCQVCFNLVQRFQRRRFKCDLLPKYAQFA